MDRVYDVFERLPTGMKIWRGSVKGLRPARLRLHEIAHGSNSSFFLTHQQSGQLIAVEYPLIPRWARPRVVFQIAYKEELMGLLANLLKRNGYEVVSVVGNECAQAVLDPPQPCDLFIIGDDAPKKARLEMVEWIKRRFARVKVIAINAPHSEDLRGADFNVKPPLDGEVIGLVKKVLSVRGRS